MSRHKIGFGGRKFTCVAGHPIRECLITGDTSGRAALWTNIFQYGKGTAPYHWHTLPVTEIAFSKSGKFFILLYKVNSKLHHITLLQLLHLYMFFYF